jgi:hypothetical protein
MRLVREIEIEDLAPFAKGEVRAAAERRGGLLEVPELGEREQGKGRRHSPDVGLRVSR